MSKTSLIIRQMEQTIYRDVLFVSRVLHSCETFEHLHTADNLITNFIKIHPEADRKLCLSLQREYSRMREKIRRKNIEESNKRFEALLEKTEQLFKEVLER